MMQQLINKQLMKVHLIPGVPRPQSPAASELRSLHTGVLFCFVGLNLCKLGASLKVPGPDLQTQGHHLEV